ncbi:MAG: hypothetical protein IT204_18265 [Fimbriimonadaceae bacterium]|nr:hypothetical protein [Fimbriimonadaceae bacterium]
MAIEDDRIASLARINPVDVLHYAKDLGWQRTTEVQPPWAAFTHPAHEQLDLLVPLEPQYADYPRRLWEVVELLATADQRAPEQVLVDLSRGRADVLRFTIEADDLDDGMLSLDRAAQVVQGTRRAVTAAACDVLRPQPFHPRLSLAAADELVAQCRFATEPGSFVARVWCPLAPAGQEEQLRLSDEVTGVPPEPLGRQVTRHLVGATAALISALQRDQTTELLQSPEPGRSGSANLLDALLELLPESSCGDLVVSVTWAAGATVPAGPRQARLPAQYGRSIRELATALRRRVAAPGPQRLVGKLVELQRSAQAGADSDGEVTLAFLDDEQARRARLSLPAEQYRLACEAHAQSKLVSLRGILHHADRLGRIESVSNFEVLD